MRVEIYWNIRAKEYSVRALQGPDKGRVVKRGHDFALTDVSYVVQKAGRDRVRREKCKNVHAFIRGTLQDSCQDNTYYARVRYNPYRDDSWNHDGKTIETSERARLTTNEKGFPVVVAGGATT
jgi:hypothetical protein